MPIRVKCEKCKKTLSVKDHLAGKKIKCPICENIVLVAAVPAPPATPAPATPAKPDPPAKPEAPPKAETPAKPATPAAKQPAVATKPVKTAKPAASPAKTNGTPPVEKKPTNGTPAAKPSANGAPAKPSEPPPVERPPESVEAEALEAFADEKPVEDETPKTIDFSCMYCEMELHLPVDQGGKQYQCPNPECKRILKVPLPKMPEKKDWRKMDRRGPLGAILNQPEQLDNAWGTEEATRARQSSLAEAGAIEKPPPPPVGIFGWLRRGFYALGVFVLLILMGVGVWRLTENRQQINQLKETMSLVDPKEGPKIQRPLLQAEAYRLLGLLYLQSTERAAPVRSRERFDGARACANVKVTKDYHGVNEQFFLMELASAHVDYSATIDQFNSKEVWEAINKDLGLTLDAMPSPEAKAIAMREVAQRLFEKDRADLAIGLAGSLGNPDIKTGRRPPVFAQQIALLFVKGEESKLPGNIKMPDLDKAKDLRDANLRVGFAEGLARKGNYDEAWKLATAEGPVKDRVEACLGVAAVASRDRKNKEHVGKFLKESLDLIKKAESGSISPWHDLELIRLGVRTEEADMFKERVDALTGEFKLRAHLELLQAKCEKATGRLTPEVLAKIEELDTEGTTLALAWMALARHNAQHGSSRGQNRRMFDDHMSISGDEARKAMIRPMVDVGTYLGSLK